MRQAFRGTVVQVSDASVYQEMPDQGMHVGETVKIRDAADFIIRSCGPCPWPPEQLFENQVAVFDLQTIQDVLRMLVKGLAKHDDDHKFSDNDKFALVVGRELLQQIASPTRQEVVDDIVTRITHRVPPAS